MLQVRRIFRPAPTTRAWRVFAGTAAAGCALLLAVALPSDLFGSAPVEAPWTAGPRDVLVIDGDTLRLGDRLIRLRGIAAPARDAGCSVPAGAGCGQRAADALAALVGGRSVECRLAGRDRQGRALGDCRAEGVELGASLVAAGWAAIDRDGGRFAALQDAAQRDGRGIWGQQTRLP